MSKLEHESVKVVSLDYDGCFGKAFDAYRHQNEAKGFFASALEGAKSLYIGTARQSRDTEYGHAINGRPSFANYERFAKECDVSLVRLLLEDVWQGQPEGTYFEEAKETVSDTTDMEALCQSTVAIKDPPNFPHKIGIAYLQMQHAAQQAEGASVEFHFYDDAGPYLKDMLAFFKRHPKLMPRNVSLRCHHVALRGWNDSGFIKNKEAFGEVTCYTSDPLQGQGIVLSEETLPIAFKATLEALAISKAERRIQIRFAGAGIDDDTDAPRETLFAETLLKHYPKNSTEAVASSETFSGAGKEVNKTEELVDRAPDAKTPVGNSDTGNSMSTVSSRQPESEKVAVLANVRAVNKPLLPSKGDSHREWLLSPKTRCGLVAGIVVGGGVFGVASAVLSVVLVNAFASAGAAASLANVLAANPVAIGLAAFALVGAVLASVMGGFLGQSRQVSKQSMLCQSSCKNGLKVNGLGNV